MLTLPPNTRIYLAVGPVDMRRSFDGLAATVVGLDLDPLCGHLFVFINKRRSHLKVLFFDRNGYAIFYKRLERGTFQLPRVLPGTRQVEVDATTLHMILEGIDLRTAVRRPRYERPRGSHHRTSASPIRIDDRLES